MGVILTTHVDPSWDDPPSKVGVSKNRDTPKWMVKIMETPYLQMDHLGGKPPCFWKHPGCFTNKCTTPGGAIGLVFASSWMALHQQCIEGGGMDGPKGSTHKNIPADCFPRV